MSQYADLLQKWLIEHEVDAELLSFDESVHSVAEAVAVSGHPIERFTKSIVMMSEPYTIIIALVSAEHRASTERVRKALGLAKRPRIATTEEIEASLPQQAGGNTPLNAASATILIDPKVLEKDWLLTGGGDDKHLVKVFTQALKSAVHFTEARVRK